MALVMAAGISMTSVSSAGANDAVISGRVTAEADGAPLAGIYVTAVDYRRHQPVKSTRSGADGSYRLVVPAGDYFVVFDTRVDPPNDEYVQEVWPGLRSAEEAEPLRLAAGQHRSRIHASLRGYGFVEGTVVDEDSGEALDRICVAVGDGSFGGGGRTGEDENRDPLPPGQYRFRAVEGQRYTARFFDCRESHTYVAEIHDDIEYVVGNPTSIPGAPVRVRKDQTTVLDGSLQQGATIAGSVVDAADGQPLERFCVAFWHDEAEPAAGPYHVEYFAPARGTAPGKYAVGGLPPGTWRVSFNYCGMLEPGLPSDSQEYAPQWYAQRRARQAADTIFVKRYEAAEGIDARLDRSDEMFVQPCGEYAIPEDEFSDVTVDNVHEFSVDCMAAPVVRVVSGRTDGTFGPSDVVQRDHMAAFLARLLALTAVQLPKRPADHFRDDDGSPFEHQINQLAELGIVKGTGAGRYRPQATVRRGAMATFLLNAMAEATGQRPAARRDHFVDDEGDVHERSINVLADEGLVTGTSSSTFSPGRATRRDQMATFLRLLLERVLSEP